MKHFILIVIIFLMANTTGFAQHSLQVDDGTGDYGIIRAALSGGTSTYTFPPGSGTIVVAGAGPSLAWLTAGNILTGSFPSTPNEVLGSNNNFDVVMRTNGAERLRLGNALAPITLSVSPSALATTAIKVNGLAATTNGVSVDMITNPVTTPASSIFQGQILGTSGANLYGGNVNVFSTNAAATGFGCTTSVNGTGNTNGVFASASSNGSGSVNGVLGSASGTGAASGSIAGGNFFATGGASTSGITAVIGGAVSTNGTAAVGGSFSGFGSTSLNLGVQSNATGSGSGSAQLFNGTATTNGAASASGIILSAVANGASVAQGMNISAASNGPSFSAIGASITASSFSVATGANLTGAIITADATTGAGSSGSASGLNVNSIVNANVSASRGILVNTSGSSTNNTGILLNVNSAAGPNQGISLNVSGAGSTGINFSSSPATGINLSATATGLSITAPLSISANGNIQTTGNNNTFGNSTATNSIVVVNGIANATVANVAGDAVWDERVNGDLLVTGIQKIGGSIWLDGTSVTHQIVTDQNVNIGTKNGGTSVSVVTGNTPRLTVDASGNTTASGNVIVNGTLQVGGGAAIQKVLTDVRSPAPLTIPANSTQQFIFTFGGLTGAAVGDPVYFGVDPAYLNSQTIYSGFVNAPNQVTMTFLNNGGAIVVPAGSNIRIVVTKF